MPIAEPGFLAVAGAAWLLSFALHSSLALGGVALLARTRRLPAAFEHTLWRAALLGSLATATALTLGWDGGALGTRWQVAPSEPVPVPANIWVEAPAIGDPAVETPVSARLSPAWTWSVLAVWGLTAALGLARLGVARHRLRRRLGPRREVTGGDVRALLDRLCRVSGVHRPIRLTVSSRLGAPIAIGRDEICLPARALRDLRFAELESALAHELGHLERGDPVWKGLTAALGAVFFFQPLLRLARRRLAESAEYLADDWAVKHLGTGMPLARCLAAVAGWQASGLRGLPVSAMADESSPLVRRVERILGGRPRDVSWKLQALGATALLAAVWGVAPGVTAVPVRSPLTAAAGVPVPDAPQWVAPESPRALVLVIPERIAPRERMIRRVRPRLRDEVTAPAPPVLVLPHAELRVRMEELRVLRERSRAEMETLSLWLESRERMALERLLESREPGFPAEPPGPPPVPPAPEVKI